MTGETQSGFPAPGRARWALIVLGLIGFLSNMDPAMVAILIEPMKRELSLTDIDIGTLQGTAYGLAYALVAIPIGRLVDSRTRVWIVMAGVLLCVLAMCGTAFAHAFPMLLLYRAALGVVAALLVPASASLLGDFYPPARRAVAISLFVVGQSFGQAFGTFAGGRLLDTFSHLPPHRLAGFTPWRALYFLAGLASFALVPLLLSVREPRRQERDAGARSFVAAARELWNYRGFVAPLLLALLFSMLWTQSLAIWPAPLLTRRFGLTPGQFAGWLSIVTLASGIVGPLLAGRLAELGRRRAGTPGALLPAVVVSILVAPAMAFGIAPTVVSFAILLAFCMFASAVMPIVGIVTINLNLPNELRGVGIGLYAVTSMLFAVAGGPALTTLISRALGGEAMLGEAILAVSAPSALLAALFFAVAMRGDARQGVGKRVASLS